VDSDDGIPYVITDVWFDLDHQEFVGTRAPIDGSIASEDDLEHPYLVDYFLRELEHNSSPVDQALPDHNLVDATFRKEVEICLQQWYGKQGLAPHEVFLIPDENNTFHYYRRDHDRATQVDNYQLIIPNGPSGTVVRNQLLYACHEGCSHLRFDKMYTELQRRCWWPGMYSEAKHYAKSCLSCQASGSTADRKERETTILRRPPVCAPFQRVSLDVLGPLGQTKSNMRYLVVAVDHFTKWTEAEAFPEVPTAQDINEFMLHHFYFRHGIPDVILADNGSNLLVNQLNALLLQDLGSQCRNVTTYHPAANGQVERFNKSICDFLKHYCDDFDHSNWDRFLEATLFAMNTSVNATTGFTPFFLVHGREARRIIDKKLPDWSSTRWRQMSWSQYAEHVQQTLQHCSLVAKERIDKAHSMYNQPRAVHRLTTSLLPLYNLRCDQSVDPSLPSLSLGRRITKRFLPGDLVLVYVPVTATNASRVKIRKLTKFWRGPFTIVKSINDVTYLVDVGKRSQAFHINRLKFFHLRDRRLIRS